VSAKRSIWSVRGCCTSALLVLATIARGQPATPFFTVDRVLPFDSARPAPLAPGMLISIYGQNLGPERGCEGQADTRRTETPNPGLTSERFVNTLIYPADLCGVQVFVGDKVAGLLYVQAKQINFKVPQDVLLEGELQLRVVFQSRSSAPVRARLGLELPKLSVEGTARVGSPVWINVEMPYGWEAVVYPVSNFPIDFGCNGLEVRQNGVALAPIAFTYSGGRSGPGNGCGNDRSIAGHPVAHQGRLPLHLQYRFEKPGVYEMRYTRKRRISSPEVLLQSEWTRIEILAAQSAPRRAQPQDPAEILNDFLPSILGFPDAASLSAVLEYVYHPNENIRRYAATSLGYWPEKEIERRIAELIRTKGPSDVIVFLNIPLAPDLIDPMLQYLRSDNPVLLRGSILGISNMVVRERNLLPVGAEARAETALVGATEHVVRTGNEQTVSNFAEALGALRGEPSGAALWDFVERGIARQQSLIAIGWRKDPRDLPRLGAILEAPATGDPLSSGASALPYSLRNNYGEAALPYLEFALKTSGSVSVQTNCARELILAGRSTGFAFVAQAIEQNRSYKRELIEFVRGQFPELRGVDDSVVLAFVKQHAG
jgi:hypothetical protein